MDSDAIAGQRTKTSAMCEPSPAWNLEGALALPGNGSAVQSVRRLSLRQTLTNAPQRPQVDEDIDERIGVGNRTTIAQVWTLDAQVERLTVDALTGPTLVVDALKVLALAVKLVTNPSADAGGQAGDAASLLDALG